MSVESLMLQNAHPRTSPHLYWCHAVCWVALQLSVQVCTYLGSTICNNKYSCSFWLLVTHWVTTDCFDEQSLHDLQHTDTQKSWQHGHQHYVTWLARSIMPDRPSSIHLPAEWVRLLLCVMVSSPACHLCFFRHLHLSQVRHYVDNLQTTGCAACPLQADPNTHQHSVIVTVSLQIKSHTLCNSQKPRGQVP